MSEVAFHFNAPDRRDYACRLLRKGYLKGARLLVLVEASELAALDVALWTFALDGFLPHSREDDAPRLQRHSPIHLVTELPAAGPAAAAQVLVNLRAAMPLGYQRYARVVEIVTPDAQDRLAARQRWQQYRLDGIEPLRHDLQSAAAD